MTTLIEINQQIEALQKQADELRVSERASTIAEINTKIAAFGLKPTELTFPAKKRKVREAQEGKVKARKSKNPVPPKFKGPNGEWWSGRGLQPRWMTKAIAAGQARESFAVAA